MINIVDSYRWLIQVKKVENGFIVIDQYQNYVFKTPEEVTEFIREKEKNEYKGELHGKEPQQG